MAIPPALPSPKLPLLPPASSFAAFIAAQAETCPPRRAASFSGAAPFIAYSAAEAASKAPPLVYREKVLFDCLSPGNASISVTLALLPAVAAELVRANILPAGDFSNAPPPEPEPFDWMLMLQNAALALARDLLSKVTQQFIEIRAKLRVPQWVHMELIKHVPTFSEYLHGKPHLSIKSSLAGRWRAARGVALSKVAYANRTLGLFVADALLVDGARLLFPADCRTRLVYASDDPAVASFVRNFKLKVGKHALSGCLSYVLGVVTPLLLPTPCPFFVGFLLGDVVAVFAAEAAVAKYGEIK